MPENGHLNGLGGEKGYFWTLKMGFPGFPESGPCRGRGGLQKWGLLHRKALFSRKWGFGPLSEVGGIPRGVGGIAAGNAAVGRVV